MEESEDESDEEEKEKEVKKPKIEPKKKPEPKKDMSDDSDDENEESSKKGETTKAKKPLPKKESDKEDSDSDEEKPKAKQTAKKEEVSDEEEEQEEEKEEKNTKKEKKVGKLPENAYEELFVRNIGFNTTEQSLAEFFQKYGDVEVAKICTDKQSGKSKGFGFLKFYEKESAVAAMNDADNIVVDGRNLQIRYSNDKNGQIKGGNNAGSARKGGSGSEFGIFVGNISYKCTDNDLKKFFKDCGKVVDVRIAKKPDGKLKGFAHIDFENKEAVDKAVEKNGEELQGRPLKIDRSKGGAGNGGNKGGFGGRGKGREPADPLAKAKRTGGIIAPKENKVTTYDDSDDD
jgi:nucleolin